MVLLGVGAAAVVTSHIAAQAEPTLHASIDVAMPSWDAARNLRVAVDGEGRLYVWRPGSLSMAVYTLSGVAADSIAIEPARSVSHVSVRGDTVVVTDRRKATLLYVSLTTQGRRVVQLPRITMPRPHGQVVASRAVDGDVFMGVGDVTLPMLQAGLDRVPIVTADANGRVRSVVAEVRLHNTVLPLAVPAGTIMATVTGVREVLDASDLWRISADGRSIVLLDRLSSAEELRLWNISLVSGDSSLVTVLQIEPLPMQATVRDSVLRAAASEVRFGAEPEEILKALESAVAYRGTWPGATDLVVGSDGEYWIRGVPRADGVSWWVVDPDGSTRGNVRLGADLKVLGVWRDRVYALRPKGSTASELTIWVIGGRDP